MKPRLSYIVCSAPRSGSTLLCAALSRTARAGRPSEYFDSHDYIEASIVKQLGIRNDAEYISKVIEAGTTPNGIFGLKLHWHQSRALTAKLLAEQNSAESFAIQQDGTANDGPTARMHHLLSARIGEPFYIWLRRKNLVAQGISYYRAGKTDFWRLPAQGRTPDEAHRPVTFDFDGIDRHVRYVEQFDRGWYGFFMRQGLKALIVVYEEFTQTYELTVRGVLRYLGLDDPELIIPPPQYRKQADNLSADFEQRYRQMRAERREATKSPPRPKRRATRRATTLDPLPLIAYDLGAGVDLPIIPAPPTRPWMDAMPRRAASRCLPLVIANQAGWFITNTQRLSAVWDGGSGLGGVKIVYDEPCAKPYASSHFGSGILTFTVGALFRTPPGYNLHVRGPANWPKDGICALEGIVETDWSRATFTMNWKFTRPHHTVTFEPGEPIAMLAPVPRGDVERFRPERQKLASNPEWRAGYEQFAQSRGQFNEALRAGAPEAVAAGWQRHYVQGITVDQVEAPEHQTALALQPFVDKRQG